VITLAHDIHLDTVHGLTQFMIDKARQAGYKLVTVGDCLGDPKSNWYRDAKTGNPVSESVIRNAISSYVRPSSSSPSVTVGEKSSGGLSLNRVAAPSGIEGDEDSVEPQISAASAITGKRVLLWMSLVLLSCLA